MLYRILSLDGGGQLEMTSTLLLTEIEKRRPGFLARTDMIAGTSAGAMVGLILATQDNPAYLLPQAEELWEKFFQLSMNSVAGAVLGIFGLGAFFSQQGLQEYLSQPGLLGDKTLSELRKKVIITSFDLEGIDYATGAKTWKPKVYDNYGRNNPDQMEKAVDVALRSGASPIFYPIKDGFIDGGLFANHPAMVAVSKVFHDWRYGVHNEEEGVPLPEATPGPEGDPVQDNLEHLRVFSVGVGENNNYVPVQNANWGYFNWALNPFNPLLVVNALLRGGTKAVDFQCHNLLSHKCYHRLYPYYARNAPIPFMVNTRDIRMTVQSPETQAMVDRAIQWIDDSGWMEKDEDEVGPAATTSGPVTPVPDTPLL
jgi:hypothetical protein